MIRINQHNSIYNAVQQEVTPSKRSTKAIWGVAFCLLLTAVVSCGSSKFTGESTTFRKDDAALSAQYHFCDLHGEIPKAAKEYGIKPIETRKQLRRKGRSLRKIRSNKYYLLDPMEHSSPFLTAGAKGLLKEIGKRFQRELARLGYRPHRIISTSMLRTREDIGKLRRVNGNAATNSSHLYATSFDLSYTRFNRIGMEGDPVDNNTMCNILGKIIFDLRKNGDCWAIYEPNQHCIHVTARR